MNEHTLSRKKLPYLREWRVTRDLTLRGLAEKAGVSVAAISRLEHGDTEANPLTVKKLAKALRIKRTTLINQDPEQWTPTLPSVA